MWQGMRIEGYQWYTQEQWGNLTLGYREGFDRTLTTGRLLFVLGYRLWYTFIIRFCWEAKERLYSWFGARFSMSPRIWSILVAKRFRQVVIAPFGPRPYLLCLEAKIAYILFHDFLVVYWVANIDICFVWDINDGGIEIENIGWISLCMEVHIETLHKSCLSRACRLIVSVMGKYTGHADADNDRRSHVLQPKRDVTVFRN